MAFAIIRNFLAKSNTNTIQQPAFTVWIFPVRPIQETASGKRFDTREEIMEKSLTDARNVSRAETSAGWHRCIAVGGDYFEGDNDDLDE